MSKPRPSQQEINDARDLRKRFRETYDVQPGCLVDGGDGTPVYIGALSTSITCADERVASFGCPLDEYALLIEVVPVGLQHDEDGNETGIDASLVPHPTNCVTLPRKFEGVPVYYKRGHVAFARGGPHRHHVKKQS